MTDNAWETYWNKEENHGRWQRPAPEVVEFIKSQSPQEKPDVLDLGCGLGRHAIALAQAGFHVTATDASETAIAHLNGWKAKLGLAIQAKTCDVLDDGFARESFDVVLSYNVIYHGYREQFAQAIEHVRALLRPDGLFYFTCHSRQDGKYGYGEEVAPHTFRCTKSITPGDIHYFTDGPDLDELLVGFELVSREKHEGHWDNKGTRQFYSTWHVLAQKPAANAREVT